MKHLILTFCFVWLTANICTAGENSSPYWTLGNKAYTQKLYDSAVFYYSKILSQQPSNALGYYNLGNAYYRSNMISHAVLNYERALFFNPSLHIAEDNLNLAKSRIPNALKQRHEIFFINWWKSSTAGNTATKWAVLSLLVFLSFLALILLTLRNKKIPGQVFLLMPVLIFILLFFAFTAAKNAKSTLKAVTMNATTIMTLSPNNYKGQIIIPEATTVETGEIKGSWIAVTLPDNREGWVQKAELTFVMPSIKK
ncbi:MAG: hypothetical protein WC716_16295 [Chitinophagaceae bacterium]|jgi:hypothetical protein